MKLNFSKDSPKFYGRRKGRKLSATAKMALIYGENYLIKSKNQTHYFSELFSSNKNQKIILEIGFGNGENLVELAKNVVAADLATKCTIQIAYAIGVSKPLSLYVNTEGTGKIEDSMIETALANLIDMSPRGIREHLKLNNPIYVPTSSYGHFGRKPNEILEGSFTWEKTDLVISIQKELGII